MIFVVLFSTLPCQLRRGLECVRSSGSQIGGRAAADDACQHTHRGHAGRDVARDDSTGADAGVVSDPEAAGVRGGDGGPGTDHDVMLDGDAVLRCFGSPEGEGHVVPDLDAQADGDAIVDDGAEAVVAEVDVGCDVGACSKGVVVDRGVELLDQLVESLVALALEADGEEPESFPVSRGTSVGDVGALVHTMLAAAVPGDPPTGRGYAKLLPSRVGRWRRRVRSR